MGGKRGGPGPNTVYKYTNAQGQEAQSIVSVESYNKAQGMGQRIASSDISSRDRAEFIDRINKGLEQNTNPNGNWDSVENVVSSVNSELADAIAGTKPKYRYRKYLDQVSALQNDQPGQLQTVLSKGGGSTALGGGML